MTTLLRSRRNDNVLIGFFVLVAVIIIVRVGTFNVGTVIAGAIAVGLTAAAVWANRRPRTELRISSSEIALVKGGQVTARLDRAEAHGKVAIRRTTYRGQLSFTLVAPQLPDWHGIGLEGFPGGVASILQEHGWEVVS